MKSAQRLASFAVFLGLLGTQAHCTFPNDWAFASGGAGGTGAAGGSAGSGAATTAMTTGGNGGTGAATSETGGSGGTTDTGATGGSGGATTTTGIECPVDKGDCDGIAANGCEADLLTDKQNCGVCDKMCPQNTPNCINAVCTSACPTDSYEPNDALQPPAPPPMAGDMRVFDANDNDFKTSDERTASVTPSFTTGADVDVFYLHVTDDTPLPAGKTVKGNGFDITLTQIPAGAEYSITSYFICDDDSQGVSVFNTNPADCPIGGANTGSSGDWWYCQRDAPAPSTFYHYGHRCIDTDIASGYLQVEVKTITPPATPTCNPYKLTVTVSQIAI